MRAFLVSSIGAACAAAVAVPLVLSTGATANSTFDAVRTPPVANGLPGSTQSLPLGQVTEAAAPPGPAEAPHRASPIGSAPGATDAPTDSGQGLAAQDVKPFSLLGVVWEDANAPLHGQVRVRTRATGTDHWSPWRELETHGHDAPDDAMAERGSGAVRGSTPPMWVGDSDGVQVKVVPEKARHGAGAQPLPEDLRLELVDPGAPAADTQHAPERPAEAAHLTPPGAAPAAGSVAAHAEGPGRNQSPADATGLEDVSAAEPFIGPRPPITTREGWGADESMREPDFVYNDSVKAAFVHHTAMSNSYNCSEAPSIIRSIYRYHVKSSGWRDIGYNFLVDKCGTIYEGRAGGVAKAVMGAHTYGFNTDTMGIALLGTYTSVKPSTEAIDALAGLTAWKLGLFGVNPAGNATLISGGGKYKKGETVRLNAIAGHRDGFTTECPGQLLYDNLDTVRTLSARLQGR